MPLQRATNQAEAACGALPPASEDAAPGRVSGRWSNHGLAPVERHVLKGAFLPSGVPPDGDTPGVQSFYPNNQRDGQDGVQRAPSANPALGGVAGAVMAAKAAGTIMAAGALDAKLTRSRITAGGARSANGVRAGGRNRRDTTGEDNRRRTQQCQHADIS